MIETEKALGHMAGKTFTDTKVPVSQAERVIAKFGGVEALVRALEAIGKGKYHSTVRRWTYPASKKEGTGGLIPTSSLIDVISAARNEGVLLTAEDLDVRISYKNVRIYDDEAYNVKKA